MWFALYSTGQPGLNLSTGLLITQTMRRFTFKKGIPKTPGLLGKLAGIIPVPCQQGGSRVLLQGPLYFLSIPAFIPEPEHVRRKWGVAELNTWGPIPHGLFSGAAGDGTAGLAGAHDVSDT